MKPRNYDEQVKKTSLCLTRYVPLTCFYTIIMQYAATKENFSHNFISVKKSGRDILTIFFLKYMNFSPDETFLSCVNGITEHKLLKLKSLKAR